MQTVKHQVVSLRMTRCCSSSSHISVVRVQLTTLSTTSISQVNDAPIKFVRELFPCLNDTDRVVVGSLFGVNEENVERGNYSW